VDGVECGTGIEPDEMAEGETTAEKIIHDTVAIAWILNYLKKSFDACKHVAVLEHYDLP